MIARKGELSYRMLRRELSEIERLRACDLGLRLKGIPLYWAEGRDGLVETYPLPGRGVSLEDEA